MKRFFYILRIIVISPEFVALALIALVTFAQPSIFVWMSSKIDTTNEMVKWFSLLPAGMVSLMVSRNSELLSPDMQGNSKVLLKWTDYYKIEYRFWICIFFGVLGTLFSVYVSVFGDLKNYVMMAVFSAGIIISSIAFVTFLSATITLKRILSINL